jgi:hypothetical protein
MPTTLLTANFNDLLPAAPAGRVNVKWQADAAGASPRNISAHVAPPGSSGSVAVVTPVPLAPGVAGNFTVAHGAGEVPAFVLIEMTSSGSIWLQSPTGYDASNLYLTSSDPACTGVAYIWVSPPDDIVPFTSTAGNFTLAHALGVAPVIGFIEFDQGGAVTFQAVPWDAANVYLQAFADGITGRVVLWKTIPNLTTSDHAAIPLAPGAAGNFQVAHGLGVIPAVLLIQPGVASIWFRTPAADVNFLYLTASDASATGTAEVWSAGGGAAVPVVSAITAVALAPSAGGNFTVPHGAGVTPKAVIIEMTSAGNIWFQTPTKYDSTNLYLVASDGPLTASAKVIT